MILLFWSVGERSRAKYYLPVSLLSVISKVLEQLVNNRLLGHNSRNVAFCLISGMISDLFDQLTVVSDKIARAFDRSQAARAVLLDISKAFHRVWHAHLLQP